MSLRQLTNKSDKAQAIMWHPLRCNLDRSKIQSSLKPRHLKVVWSPRLILRTTTLLVTLAKCLTDPIRLCYCHVHASSSNHTVTTDRNNGQNYETGISGLHVLYQAYNTVLCVSAAAAQWRQPETFWMTSATCSTTWLTSWTPCWSDILCASSR